MARVSANMTIDQYIQAFRQSYGEADPGSAAAKLLKKADADGNDMTSVDELTAAVTGYDKDGDGALGAKELGKLPEVGGGTKGASDAQKGAGERTKGASRNRRGGTGGRGGTKGDRAGAGDGAGGAGHRHKGGAAKTNSGGGHAGHAGHARKS